MKYKNLIEEKNKIERNLRLLLIKKIKKVAFKGNDLLDLAKLKIKGGPKDLSQKLDSYLYSSK